MCVGRGERVRSWSAMKRMQGICTAYLLLLEHVDNEWASSEGVPAFIDLCAFTVAGYKYTSI